MVAQGRLAEAIGCFRQALSIQPQHADAYINLGIALKEQGQINEEIECYREALRLNPRHSQGFNNLGIALVALERLEEGATCFREALRIDPANARAYYNLGNFLLKQAQWAAATDCYRKTLSIQPNHLDALNSLGLVLRDQGQLSEAAWCFEQALKIDQRNGWARFNRATLRLLKGDLEGGWREFDSRWEVPGVIPRSFAQPRWDGSFLAGKKILVYCEQGLGDSIQFLRYLPMVKDRCGTLIVDCHRALASLVAAIPWVDQVVECGAPLPAFDVQIPLLSLPNLFGTTLENIPNIVPYLAAEPQLINKWRGKLEKELASVRAGSSATERLRIGIAWQGDPRHPGYPLKSFPLSFFTPLAEIEGVRLVSLQVGLPESQIGAASFPIVHLGSRFDPFSLNDLAAALMTVDLVVTLDSAVAHLAGALAVPTWVLLPFVADWRWLECRTDSPWYPTMRLFRQTEFGNWHEVFERIEAEIRRVAIIRRDVDNHFVKGPPRYSNDMSIVLPESVVRVA